MTTQEQLRVTVLYPANLASQRATPTRARINIQAVKQNVHLEVVEPTGNLDSPGTHPDEQNLENPNDITRVRGFLTYTRKALQRLEAFKPNVVHAITTVAALPAVLYKRRYPSIRLVFEMHGLSYFEQQELQLFKRLGLGLIDYWGARRADVIIAMSYTQRDLINRLFRTHPAKVQVLWGPVDLDVFYTKDPSPSPPFIVGYSGNDLFWQGLETVFDACRLLEPYEDIRFLLMGFPGERYAKLGLRNATFTGPLSREETPAYLNRCHVLLSPRIAHKATETQYPFKLSAYLATGRPVIATAVNDQPVVINQANCGVIVPPGNAEALAEAILGLYRMPESARLALGRNARSFAENNLSISHLTEALLRIYMGAAE